MTKAFKSVLFVFLFVFLAISSSADSFPDSAISMARTFCDTIDSENYQVAFFNTSPLFQMINQEQDWTENMELNRLLLGGVTERKLEAVRKVSTYPGMPDGEYLLVYFETQTEKKAKAAEVILLGKNKGSWNIHSYRMQ